MMIALSIRVLCTVQAWVESLNEKIYCNYRERERERERERVCVGERGYKRSVCESISAMRTRH